MTLHKGYFLATSGQTSQAHPHQLFSCVTWFPWGHGQLHPSAAMQLSSVSWWAVEWQPSSVATRLPCSSPKIAFRPGGHL